MGRYTRKGYELDQTGQEAQDLLNAINNKVDKEDGKSLISDEDKAKLDNIEERAQRNTIETIKRNGVALPINDKGVNISVPTKVADLEQDYTHRTVTDAEKDKWNDKQEKPAPVRYAVLKSMRDTGGLTVGKTYRITDYVATVRRSAQYSEAMSANHPFDIIVTAIDERHLSEECLAAMHEGDIYFANSDLSAWKIWYTIDNDTAAYDWADPANGKGVIYRMIDEYANDLGYDFKGILIARHPVTPAEGYEDVLADISGMWLGPKGSAVPAGITVDTTQTKWFYTFSHLTDGWDNPTDASLRKGINAVYNATITSVMRSNIRFLSGNVFMNGPFVVSTLEALAVPGSEITGAHVWHFRAMGDCTNNTFFGYAGCSDCMSQLRYNIFVGDFRHNRLATDVEGNTIVAPGDISFNDIWCANMVVRAREFSRNSGGGYTSGTVLKTSGYVSYNKFPNYFADNRITAAGNISANEFGTSFYQNTFTLTGQFTGNKFTGYCYENNIGCSNFTNNEAAYFHANTISTTEGVNACVFGPYFESNTLGGRLTNVRFSSGQTRFCNFSGIVGCTFDGIMEYVTVPTVSGKRFTHCDVRGGVRGTSSVPVVLDYDAFFLASAAGVSRRVTIEGSADGKIVAMWADGGALKGVMKAPNGNWADMGFVTKAVNDLLNYYLKSETYTKTEVNQLVAGINNWEIVSVAQLPEASADTMHKIYFVPSSNPEARNVKDEYITIENSGIYSWEQIGSTTIDLTNYVTKQEFTIALADYVTSSAFTQALATKQDTLVSGQNIKTLNGFSILGGGDLSFPGPVQSDWNEDDDGDYAYIKNKPTDIVKYTEQELTEAQQEQARDNIGAAATSGYYPDLHVGEADYLPGTEVEQVEGISTVAKSTGIAQIKEVKGRSLVWNQQVKNGDFSDGLTDWNHSSVIAMVNADDVTIHATSESYTAQNLNQAIPTISGHKYLLSFIYKSDTAATAYFANANGVSLPASESFVEKKLIITSSGYGVLRFYPSSGAQYSPSAIFTLKKRIVAHDLTQLFGSGNEPSTVAAFESWLASNIGYRDYYAYNPGEIISNNTEALEITGLNQWDEEWEVGGIDDTTGEKSTASTQIRSKNFIPCTPSTGYYICGIAGVSIYIYFYDASGGFIGRAYISGSYNVRDKVVTTPSNCVYMMMKAGTLTTYNNDICISLSGSRNGQYEPYQKSEFALDLPTITGKLNGEGESVVIFPEGMRSAGTAHDSLIVDEDGWCRRAVRRMAEVDMGTLDWGTSTAGFRVSKPDMKSQELGDVLRLLCEKYVGLNVEYNNWISSDKAICLSPRSISASYANYLYVRDSAHEDAATFKTAMAGVPLIYELATPLEYVLDTPIYMGIKTQQGGVIRQLPKNGDAPTTAPMRMDISYALPPEALISGSSLENLLKALKSANKISNYTMTYNATSGKWEFTIS